MENQGKQVRIQVIYILIIFFGILILVFNKDVGDWIWNEFSEQLFHPTKSGYYVVERFANLIICKLCSVEECISLAKWIGIIITGFGLISCCVSINRQRK